MPIRARITRYVCNVLVIICFLFHNNYVHIVIIHSFIFHLYVHELHVMFSLYILYFDYE